MRRFAHVSNDAGAVLVPDAPYFPVALIDVRDLADWLVLVAAGQRSGTFSAVGDPMPFPDHLEVARSVARHGGSVIAAAEEWLREHGVREWSGSRSLPLWLASRTWYGMNARSNAGAVAAGLQLRPLSHTLTDTLAEELPWAVDQPLGAGLPDSEEIALLEALGG